ncbi:Afadin [Holothuria leucospilota]|uniref:Afadin n=1 Tax=Holothuria leucospilota TaxID=206669 RepID=A0A9Q1BIH5_HOLLE|nr:Afadin [Holothuria leucospilota]
MRFFYQDEAEKISTKCIRVSSTATTRDVIDTLVDKFHPDMRMLTRPELSLYEVHNRGEERKLELNELPLRVQLNWTKDLREGRFLLRNASAKSKPNFYKTDGVEPPPGNFQRKLSKREKKELKKKEKEAKLKGITHDDSTSPKLYDNLSKTFTRTISNPEGVLRRKRQQKVEQMERYRNKPDSGGVLKVYAHTVFPEANYKTILVPFTTPASLIVKQSLENFGHPNENPNEYCLVRVILPPGADPNDYVKEKGWNQEAFMDEDEFPLEYLRQKRPEGKGDIIFELKRRPADYKPRPKRRKNITNQERLPYFLELNLDGTDVIDYKPTRHKLLLNVTEVGSQRDPNGKAPFLELRSPGILPRHCVIANMEGVVTLTPSRPDALVTVDDRQLHETMVLQHGNVVRFANAYAFRFCDPKVEDPGWEERQRTLSQSDQHGMETTFDADGTIETKAAPDPVPTPRAPVKQYILPATLEFREPSENAFLKALIAEVNGAHVHFKLAPTYALYLACRYRLSKAYRPNIDLTERAQRLTPFINKIADVIDNTVRAQYQIAMAMTFWLANGSEFHHFLQKDLDMTEISQDAQDILFQSTQDAFRHLVRRIRFELNITLGAFFDPSGDADIEKDFDDDEQMKAKDNERWMTPPTRNQKRGKPTIGEVLHILSSVMTLLRRCRVNAALTIQLFSQLFHFINVFLFNRFFAPPPHPKITSRVWGERLERRLERVFEWAEKQGLELAANAHLSKVHQAIRLLAMEKTNRGTLEAACRQAVRLNSRQLGTLLEIYQPGQGEGQIPKNVISEMVAIHRKTNDEADANIGRPLVLEEDPELRIPIIIAEDGYSSDIVKDIPNGLPEFLDPLVRTGIARFSLNPMAIGTWTVYMHPRPPTPEPVPEEPTTPDKPPPSPVPVVPPTGKPMPQVKADAKPPPEKTEPDIVTIDLDKGTSPSMGLSIVALKAPTQDKMGIYVKAVVPGGAGAKDGRIKAGDQILEVDGNNIVGLDRDEATKFLVKSGRVVRLKVAQQGAIFHGLAGILSQPSPPLPRANLGQRQQPPQEETGPAKHPVPQPRRFDDGRRSPTNSDSSYSGRPGEPHDWRNTSTMPRSVPAMAGLTQADKARSSPNLADERASTLPPGQRYPPFQPEPRERVSSVSTGKPAERHRLPQKGGLAQRSKSTSQLDPDNFDDDGGYPRHSQSSSNLNEPLYKGKAPPEEPPFRGATQGKVFLDQLDQEPYRRQPQPREEDRPVPQPRGRPNMPQTGGQPRQVISPASEPQQRMQPQGFHSSGPMNNTRMSGPPGQPRSPMDDQRMVDLRGSFRINGPPGQPRMNGPGHPRMGGPPGQPRIGGPPGQPRMTGPPGQQRMAGPPGQQRMAGPPGQQSMNGPQSRMNGPAYQNRLLLPNNQGQANSINGPIRSYSTSNIPQNYEQPRPPLVKETHFPAEEPRRDDRRSVEPQMRHSPNFNQPPQVTQQRQQPSFAQPVAEPPRMRLPPNGQASQPPSDPREHMPGPPPANYEVPFADLPPPPDDLTSPATDLLNIPDDLPPPPPPEISAWDDELDDYQKMFEEQQRQLDEELKLLQAADDDLSNNKPDKPVEPVVEKPAYASLPRQGRINQPSTPLGDQQQRPPLQRQPSNGPIPVVPPTVPTSVESFNRQPSGGFETQHLNNSYRTPQPLSVSKLMPPAPKNESISPSAWDRDEQERQEKHHESELLRRKIQEINDLSRLPSRTPQQQERLRKLQVEIEFQKRVLEDREGNGDSNDEEEVTRATVKARMVHMTGDESENSLQNMLSKPPPARGQEKNHADYMDNQNRRLQQLQEERMRQQQEERMRQQQEQERLRRQKQVEEQMLQRQEEEMQRRYEQQKLEYDRREKQIEQERQRLEQQLNLRNGPSQPSSQPPTSPYGSMPTQVNVSMGYAPGPERPQLTTQVNSNPANYNGYYQGRPFQSGMSTQPSVQRGPPPVSSKPPVAPKPAVAPKPNLQVQIPNNHVEGTPSNNNYAPVNINSNGNAKTPEYQQNSVYRTGETPGVIGAQEVYINPYERKIMAQKKQQETPNSPVRPLSFKDKLKAFSEDGNTPPVSKTRTSKWEQKFLAENPDVLQS